MIRWSPGRLQLVGYLLGVMGAILIAVVAMQRPSIGPPMLIVAVILVIAGAVAIGLAQHRSGPA